MGVDRVWKWVSKKKPVENPLTARVLALEARVQELDQLELEWQSMFDKFSGLLKRWQKRDRDELVNGTAPQAPQELAELNPMALRLLARGGK